MTQAINKMTTFGDRHVRFGTGTLASGSPSTLEVDTGLSRVDAFFVISTTGSGASATYFSAYETFPLSGGTVTVNGTNSSVETFLWMAVGI
jgi:hypothetical protein